MDDPEDFKSPQNPESDADEKKPETDDDKSDESDVPETTPKRQKRSGQ